MRLMGRDDMANNPDMEHNDGRVIHTDAIDQAISDWTMQFDIDSVLDTLEQAEVPASKIYTAKDIYEDPHYRARDMIERHTMPDGSPIDIPGVVPKMSATPGGTRWLGPELGEHTDSVLEGLGYSSDIIAKLKADGIV